MLTSLTIAIGREWMPYRWYSYRISYADRAAYDPLQIFCSSDTVCELCAVQTKIFASIQTCNKYIKFSTHASHIGGQVGGTNPLHTCTGSDFRSSSNSASAIQRRICNYFQYFAL